MQRETKSSSSPPAPSRCASLRSTALLYLPGHPRQQLLRALRIPALSPGWQASFRSLLEEEPGSGNAGLAASEPAARLAGLPSADRHRDHPRKRLGDLDTPRGPRRCATTGRAPRPVPHAASPGGQGAADRCSATTPSPDRPMRATTASPSSANADGVASGYLHTRLAVGDQLEIAAPRGTFILDRTNAPVLLISAGIGATPVLAMLQALAEKHSDREIWWLHAARNSREHAFAAEARDAPRFAPERARARLLQPSRAQTMSEAATSTARAVSRGSLLAQLDLPQDAQAYLCGPDAFHGRDQRRVWRRWGSTPRASTPSRSAPRRALPPGSQQHPYGHLTHPSANLETAPRSSSREATSRSRGPLTTTSLLELAEACDVPVRWSCRTGVCHTCETTLIAGDVELHPDPVEPPADGSALICCSQPRDDLVLDL